MGTVWVFLVGSNYQLQVYNCICGTHAIQLQSALQGIHLPWSIRKRGERGDKERFQRQRNTKPYQSLSYRRQWIVCGPIYVVLSITLSLIGIWYVQRIFQLKSNRRIPEEEYEDIKRVAHTSYCRTPVRAHVDSLPLLLIQKQSSIRSMSS